MAFVTKDGSGTTQYLPNTGIDTCYAMSDNATITGSNTSATDVYQMVGAAGIVARLRRIEMFATVVIAAPTTVAADSTLVRLARRSTAGATGTWTALTEANGKIGRFLASSAAASCIWNAAGTTAFTVGTGTQILRQGFVCHPSLLTTTNITAAPSGTMMIWEFGVNGMSPCYCVGVADFLDVNLNGVTPVGTLAINACWDEATV